MSLCAVQDYEGSVHKGYRLLNETSNILLKRTTWQLEIRSRSGLRGALRMVDFWVLSRIHLKELKQLPFSPPFWLWYNT